MSDSSSSSRPITIRNLDFEDLLSDTPIGSGPDFITLSTVGVGAAPVPSPRPLSRTSMVGGPSGIPSIASPFPSVGQISSAASGASSAQGSDSDSNRSSAGGPIRRRRVISRRARARGRGAGGRGRGGRGGGRGGRGGGRGGRGGGRGSGGGRGGSGSSSSDDGDKTDAATRVRRDRRIRDLRQELQALLNDAGQAAKGRHIAGITTTQTITTTYKDNGRPSVNRTSMYSSG